MINAANFLFHFVKQDDREKIAAVAEETSLPMLGPSLAKLQDLSRQVGDFGERAYFFEILQKLSFSMVSPRTGNPVESGGSVLLLYTEVVVFSFPSEPSLAVVAAHLGHGYPLSVLIDFDKQVVISIGHPVWGFNRGSLEKLSRVVQDWAPSTLADKRIVFAVSSQNPAHYAQNQLPAALYLAAGKVSASFSVVAGFQPLGTLSALCPEHVWDESFISPHGSLNLNRPGTLFVPLGSIKVSKDVAARALAYADRQLGPEANKIIASIAGGGPRLWLSVRTDNRTPVNQIALLVALGQRFLQEYETGHVIIDGYSIPADFEEKQGVVYHDDLSAGVSKDMTAALAIKAELKAEGYLERIHVTVGLPLLDSLAIAKHADFFFCHLGTLHAKIFLLIPCPGVLHSNKARMSSVNWPDAIVACSEATGRPTLLPMEMITKEYPNESDDERLKALQYDIYDVDIIPTVDFVMNMLADLLAKTRSRDLGGLPRSA